MPSMSPEYNKQYYKTNKEKHKAYYAKRIMCACGREVARSTYNKHLNTNIHKKHLNAKTNS